jgi:antitoxin MazE
MKARLVNMGNSRGVRLPKPLIEQAGLGDDVELELRDGAIVISAVRAPRSGWAEAAARLSSRPDSGLLDAPVPTHFDEDEWRW